MKRRRGQKVNFTRNYSDKRYKVTSSDGAGLELCVPRYKKTSTWIGLKKDAEKKGLKGKGTQSFYQLSDGTVVMDGYLAEPADGNTVVVKIRGELLLTEATAARLMEEIRDLINNTEEG